MKKRFGDQVIHGQWFEYEDKRGVGYAQTDLLIDLSPLLILIECKLKATLAAQKKVRGTYLPLVQHCWPSHEVRAMQVCKFFPLSFKELAAEEFDEILADDVYWTFHTLKWRL